MFLWMSLGASGGLTRIFTKSQELTGTHGRENKFRKLSNSITLLTSLIEANYKTISIFTITVPLWSLQADSLPVTSDFHSFQVVQTHSFQVISCGSFKGDFR